MKDEKQIQTIYIDNNDDSDDEINLREVFEKYSYHWKWFIFGLILALALSLYLFTIIRIISTRLPQPYLLKIRIVGVCHQNWKHFQILVFLVDGKKKSIINETGVLKSRTLIERVIKDLGIHITYFKEGNVVNKEIYGSKIFLLRSIFLLKIPFFKKWIRLFKITATI